MKIHDIGRWELLVGVGLLGFIVGNHFMPSPSITSFLSAAVVFGFLAVVLLVFMVFLKPLPHYPDDPAFRKQVAFLIVGALIAFVPSFVQSQLQMYEQRNQFLFEQRVSALKDYMAALNGDGEIFDQYDQCEGALLVAIDDPESDEAQQKALNLCHKQQALQTRYTADVRTKTMMLRLVFHEPIPMPTFPVGNLPRLPLMKTKNRKDAEKQLTESEQKLLPQIHQLHQTLIAQIDDCYKLADLLTNKAELEH